MVELRAYWAIIRRRIWIVALVFGIIALFAAFQYYTLQKTPGALRAYHSEVTLRVGLQAVSTSNSQIYSDYVTTSEVLADELTTGPILTSKEFTNQLAQQIQTDMPQIQQRFGTNANLGDWQNTGALGNAFSASRIHNVVTLSVTWSTSAGAWAVANAAGEVMTAHVDEYLDYIVNTAATQRSTTHPPVAAQVISQAAQPSGMPGYAGNRPVLLLMLLLVALIIGIALAFLIEYLDDRIRSQDELVQLLQLPSYGAIPRAPSLSKSGAHQPPLT